MSETRLDSTAAAPGEQRPASHASAALDPRRTIAAAVTSSVRELALLPALVAIMVAGTIASPAFLTTQNLTTVVQFSAALGLLVVGESLILIFGELDLSLQSIYGLAPMLAAYLTVHPNVRLGIVGSGTDLPPAVGLLVLLAVGAVVGLFNSVLVVKLKMNAFILGLAMLILLAGLQQGVPNDATVFMLPPSFIYIGANHWLGVPVAAWLEIAVFLGVGLFLRYHRTGRSIYAIGGNIEAARAAGIKVDRIRIGCWVFAGVLAAVAGLMDRGTGVCGDGHPGRYAGNHLHRVRRGGDRRHLLDGGKRPDGRGVYRGAPAVTGSERAPARERHPRSGSARSDGAIIVLALLVTRAIGHLQNQQA